MKMKSNKLYLVTVLIGMVLSQGAMAKIWRINNRTETIPITRDFSSLSDAIAAAASGDTLHVEPSNTTYVFPSAGLAGKTFVFIGNGYFLQDTLKNNNLGWAPPNYTNNSGSRFSYDDWVAENFIVPYSWDYFGNTSYQWYDVMSTIDLTQLVDGAGLMNGSKFMGIRFTKGFIDLASAGNYDVDVLFQRCFFDAGDSTSTSYQPIRSVATATYSNVTFRQCFFYGGGMDYSTSAGSVSDLTVENCIIFNSKFDLPFLVPCTKIIIRNNTILVHPRTFQDVANVANCYYVNNILYNAAQVSFGPSGVINDQTIIRNNLFTFSGQSQPGNPVNNVDNLISAGGYTLSDLFKLIPDQSSSRNFNKDTTIQVPDLVNGGTKDSTYRTQYTVYFTRGKVTWDAQYKLASGSPAIGAGRDGVTESSLVVTDPDLGAFGGPNPYKASGIPEVPTIYRITATSSVIRGCVLQVTIDTRGNN